MVESGNLREVWKKTVEFVENRVFSFLHGDSCHRRGHGQTFQMMNVFA